jgi:chemotaxis-related protein WspB
MSGEARTENALRFTVGDQTFALPLAAIHHVVGYVTLHGTPDEWFLGWLRFHGEPVPVFDLCRVISDIPTPPTFGSRIIIVDAPANSTTPHIGLLAAGVTDTIATTDAEITPFELSSYLPLLAPLVPQFAEAN